jgi:hypothetical protein
MEPKPTSHSRAGRPSKLTEDRIARLTEALHKGHTRRAAAAFAGIAPSTLCAWLDAATVPDAPVEFLEFMNAVRAAELDAEDQFLAVIRDAAARGTWQAAAWALERRYSADWSKKTALMLDRPPEPSQSQIERTIADANAAAASMMRIPEFIGRPLDDWPADVRAAAGV